MFVCNALVTNNMSLKSMKSIVFIDMHVVVIVIFGTSNILKPGCNPFTLSFD